jgi:uncharacterized protein
MKLQAPGTFRQIGRQGYTKKHSGEKMKTKTLLISVVLLVAVLLSACGSPAVMSASGAQPAVRALTVSGTGQVSLKPDIAYIYIGVHTENPSASEAVAQNNTKTQALLDALKAAGVAADDLRTTNFSIWTQTQYDPATNQPSGTNYAVDNTVYMTVRDLPKLGDLLDAAVKAGANNINSIQFDVADKTKAMSDARAAAVQNAKKQADELATAAGVSLGNIQSISYYDSVPTPVFEGKGIGGGGADAAALSVPINPGQLQITVSVTMSYEIK